MKCRRNFFKIEVVSGIRNPYASVTAAMHQEGYVKKEFNNIKIKNKFVIFCLFEQLLLLFTNSCYLVQILLHLSSQSMRRNLSYFHNHSSTNKIIYVLLTFKLYCPIYKFGTTRISYFML
jgi:hypothetical protein